MASPKKDSKQMGLFSWGPLRKKEGEAVNPFQAILDRGDLPPMPGTIPDGTLYRKDVALSELKPGQCGTIQTLKGNARARLRLLEMGLTPGTHVKVVHIAAFGGPMDILVRGYQLSLRREEASAVWLGEGGSHGSI
jgi:ferrous iron transport protein A